MAVDKIAKLHAVVVLLGVIRHVKDALAVRMNVTIVVQQVAKITPQMDKELINAMVYAKPTVVLAVVVVQAIVLVAVQVVVLADVEAVVTKDAVLVAKMAAQLLVKVVVVASVKEIVKADVVTLAKEHVQEIAMMRVK